MKILAAKKLKPFVFSVLVSLSSISYAGIPVVDPSTIKNLHETIKQYEKQVQQYALQLQQYENMIKNTLAPAAYVWDQAQMTINQIKDKVNEIQKLKAKLGDGSYLDKFQDTAFYKNSPCFTLNTCTEENLASLEFNSEYVKSANADLTIHLEDQQDTLINDANTLTQLQAQASSAQGQMQALQAANQLASAQANQLLQMRHISLTYMQAQNAQAQAQADEKSRHDAITEKAFIQSPITGANKTLSFGDN